VVLYIFFVLLPLVGATALVGEVVAAAVAMVAVVAVAVVATIAASAGNEVPPHTCQNGRHQKVHK